MTKTQEERRSRYTEWVVVCENCDHEHLMNAQVPYLRIIESHPEMMEVVLRHSRTAVRLVFEDVGCPTCGHTRAQVAATPVLIEDKSDETTD